MAEANALEGTSNEVATQGSGTEINETAAHETHDGNPFESPSVLARAQEVAAELAAASTQSGLTTEKASLVWWLRHP